MSVAETNVVISSEVAFQPDLSQLRPFVCVRLLAKALAKLRSRTSQNTRLVGLSQSRMNNRHSLMLGGAQGVYSQGVAQLKSSSRTTSTRKRGS